MNQRAIFKTIYVAELPDLLPTGIPDQPPTEIFAQDQQAGAEARRVAAVVIDTLRFTSTACVALSQGARSVCVASEIAQAEAIAASDADALLCGERHCHPIPGFHLGNSPAEYVASRVAGRHLVFTTTNGTRAVAATNFAHTVALGALLNRRALADWLVETCERDVWIICAGTDRHIAAEDVVTAGAIIRDLLERQTAWKLGNDSAHIALALFDHVQAQGPSGLETLLCQSSGGRNLREAGYHSDLAAVSSIDSVWVVPQLNPRSGRFEAFERRLPSSESSPGL